MKILKEIKEEWELMEEEWELMEEKEQNKYISIMIIFGAINIALFFANIYILVIGG